MANKFMISSTLFYSSKMPPGPWGLPYLGVAYKLNKEAPHFTYTEWNEKYGGIISFTLFGKCPQFAVVIIYMTWGRRNQGGAKETV